MNEQDTTQVLLVLKALDPQGFVKIDKPTIAVWVYAMNRPHPVPGQAALQVAMDYAATQDRFPTPKVFRHAVLERVCALPTLEAAEAQVRRCWRENYPGLPVKYDPDRIVLDAAKEVGGIYALRNAKDEGKEERWWKRFREVYVRHHEAAAAQLKPAEVWAELAPATAGAISGGSGR